MQNKFSGKVEHGSIGDRLKEGEENSVITEEYCFVECDFS
jgi:hypothetical protein